jgi:RNA polymerase sigma-70 factor (ECF subfamily)
MRLVATAPPSFDPADDPRDERVMRLFAEHGDGVFRLALLMLGRPADAEDIVQETFLRLLRHLTAGGSLPNARGWIFTVAAHACRDRQRAGHRWLPWLAERDTRVAPDRTDAADGAQTIVRAVRLLNRRDRLLIALRAEGCSYQEIAAAAGLAPASTGRIVARALDRLANALGVSR